MLIRNERFQKYRGRGGHNNSRGNGHGHGRRYGRIRAVPKECIGTKVDINTMEVTGTRTMSIETNTPTTTTIPMGRNVRKAGASLQRYHRSSFIQQTKIQTIFWLDCVANDHSFWNRRAHHLQGSSGSPSRNCKWTSTNGGWRWCKLLFWQERSDNKMRTCPSV